MADPDSKTIVINLMADSSGFAKVQASSKDMAANLDKINDKTDTWGRKLKTLNRGVVDVKNTFTQVYGQLEKIGGIMTTTFGIGNSVKQVLAYEQSIVSLSAQMNKYGVSVTQAEAAVVSLGKNLAMTREESVKLFSSFEKGLPYASLKATEKILENIRGAVGSNLDAMQQMGGVVMQLASTYPSLQKSIEDMGEVDKERLSNIISMELASGRMQLAQAKALRDYVAQNKQLSKSDKDALDKKKEMIADAQELKKTFEEIGLAIGKEIIPWLQKFSKFLTENRDSLAKFASILTKVIIPALAVQAGGRILKGLTGGLAGAAGSMFGGLMPGRGGRGGGAARNPMQGALNNTFGGIINRSRGMRVAITNWPASLGPAGGLGGVGRTRHKDVMDRYNRRYGGGAMRGIGRGVAKYGGSALAGIGGYYAGRTGGEMLAGSLGAGEGTKKAAGFLGGVAGGAGAGAMVGGPWGAVIGGAVGAISFLTEEIMSHAKKLAEETKKAEKKRAVSETYFINPSLSAGEIGPTEEGGRSVLGQAETDMKMAKLRVGDKQAEIKKFGEAAGSYNQGSGMVADRMQRELAAANKAYEEASEKYKKLSSQRGVIDKQRISIQNTYILEEEKLFQKRLKIAGEMKDGKLDVGVGAYQAALEGGVEAKKRKESGQKQFGSLATSAALGLGTRAGNTVELTGGGITHKRFKEVMEEEKKKYFEQTEGEEMSDSEAFKKAWKEVVDPYGDQTPKTIEEKLESNKAMTEAKQTFFGSEQAGAEEEASQGKKDAILSHQLITLKNINAQTQAQVGHADALISKIATVGATEKERESIAKIMKEAQKSINKEIELEKKLRAVAKMTQIDQKRILGEQTDEWEKQKAKIDKLTVAIQYEAALGKDVSKLDKERKDLLGDLNRISGEMAGKQDEISRTAADIATKDQAIAEKQKKMAEYVEKQLEPWKKILEIKGQLSAATTGQLNSEIALIQAGGLNEAGSKKIEVLRVAARKALDDQVQAQKELNAEISKVKEQAKTAGEKDRIPLQQQLARLEADRREGLKKEADLKLSAFEIDKATIYQNSLRLELRKQETSKLEVMVGMMDNFMMGVGASAEMRIQVIKSLGNQIVEVDQQIASAEAKMNSAENAETKKKFEKELNGLQIERLNLMQKQAQQGKALRDGWIGAMNAMTVGSGRITKIVMGQEKSTGMALQYLDKMAVSAKSGAMGQGYRAGEKFGTSFGEIENKRMQGPYDTTMGGKPFEVEKIIQGNIKGAMEEFADRLGKNIAGIVAGGGSALGASGQPARMGTDIEKRVGKGGGTQRLGPGEATGGFASKALAKLEEDQVKNEAKMEQLRTTIKELEQLGGEEPVHVIKMDFGDTASELSKTIAAAIQSSSDDIKKVIKDMFSTELDVGSGRTPSQ